MSRTKADRKFDWAAGRELERKDAEIDRLLGENTRLRRALIECAAHYLSPPCTAGEAMGHVQAEFLRRMQVATDALNE